MAMEKKEQPRDKWDPNRASARIIRMYLADKRVSAAEFATRVGVSRPTVYHWQDGLEVGHQHGGEVAGAPAY